MKASESQPLVVMVTGLSGAGLKTAINALEDSGVYCIDNLPLEMIHPAVEALQKEAFIRERGIALGVHIRTEAHVAAFFALQKKLRDDYRLDTLFLTADDDILELRYSATRRRHPLLSKGLKIQEAITLEKHLMGGVHKFADLIIDTSLLSPHELARMIESRYRQEVIPRSLYVSLISFGFKHGQCRPVDSLFDVRFLQNPHFVPSLRQRTGLEPEVCAYIFQDKRALELLDRLLSWHTWLLPHYYQEGKHFFRIAIGCTGGQHRSVAMVEKLYEKLREQELANMVFSKSHRDLEALTPP